MYTGHTGPGPDDIPERTSSPKWCLRAGCRDAPPLVQGPPGETSGFALIHVGTLLFHGDRDGLAHSGLGCFERRGSGGGC